MYSPSACTNDAETYIRARRYVFRDTDKNANNQSSSGLRVRFCRNALTTTLEEKARAGQARHNRRVENGGIPVTLRGFAVSRARAICREGTQSRLSFEGQACRETT